MGLPIDGYEDEIVVMMKKMNSKRKKGKGKGWQISTKFDKEMKKLEWMVRDRRYTGWGPGKRAEGANAVSLTMRLRILSWNVRGANDPERGGS